MDTLLYFYFFDMQLVNQHVFINTLYYHCFYFGLTSLYSGVRLHSYWHKYKCGYSCCKV